MPDVFVEYAELAARRLGQQSLFALTEDAPCGKVPEREGTREVGE